MQYRHSFHAGNFADVHKHVALLALLAALQRTPAAFTYLDTHAGAGLYDLGDAEARRSGESNAGVARLFAPDGSPRLEAAAEPAIARYLELLARIRGFGGAHCYPGSPLLACAALRADDRAICVESQAQQARALQRAAEHCAGALAVAPRVITGDGYIQIKALLPPPQRRALVLIDPPYEQADEPAHIATALAAALERFETGVYAIWYPVKRRRDTDQWLNRLARGITRPLLSIELCIHPADNTAGLNGSGMLVLNPPWQFDVRAPEWQDTLHDLLGGNGGCALRWLVNE